MKPILKILVRCLTVVSIAVVTPYRTVAQVVINEYSCSNFDTFQDDFQEYGDWIELYNSGSTAANISGYYLSDNVAAPQKWLIPSDASIPANGFMRFWASGRDLANPGNYHTNFKLTQTKSTAEFIVLADPTGTIIDQQQISITQKGHSTGRKPNGSADWSVFTSPTPGNSNSTAAFTRYAEKPVMNVAGGFYTSVFTVSISTTEPDSKIRYTINGSEPVASSPIYTNPVSVASTKIIKARVFSNDATILPGLIEFNTYFINEDYSLPVVSIAATDLTTLLNGNGAIIPWGSIEYYNVDKVRTTSGYGEFGKHGQDSWANPQRSLDYKMRDECGYNYAILEHLFSDTDRDEYQKIILRACGDDNYPGIDSSAQIRDDFVQTVSVKAGMSLDERKSARCIVFANGQYWGVYSIREKPNDHDFTKFYYDQDKYDLYYLMLWGSTWAEYGGQAAFDDWNALYSYIMTHNMAIASNYDYVEARFDPTSLVDYMLINSFVVCSDWLNWNVGWWKGTNPNGGHKRWGYILWDEDATFGHYINYTGIPAQNPYVSPCFQEDITGSSDPEGHVKILNKLRQNTGFEQYYVSRYADLLNTAFKPSNIIPLFDSLVNLIAPEMQKHCVRWGGNIFEWNENVQKIRDFVNTRYTVVASGLKECYSITGPYQVVVNMDPPGAGQVQINSLTLKDYPWTGNYYGGMDTKLSAIETNQQYKFDHWEVNNSAVLPSDTAQNMQIQLTANDSVVAVFVPRIFSDSLVINEINYNSSPDFDPGDWVELYNPQSYDLDISNWVFKDEDDLHAYVFNTGTVIPAHGYIVIANDMIAFHALFPSVTNYVGPMGFGLAGGGELIRIFDETGTLIDTVHYDDVTPWPTRPDGQGATLELISPVLDNALGENWKASAINTHGTPGAENSINVGLGKPIVADNLTLTIYPNPIRNTAILKINTQSLLDDGTLEIYNLSRQKIQQIEHITSKQVELNRSGLQPGCYIIRFTNLTGNLSANCKMLVE
jgi:hypothetical protein